MQMLRASLAILFILLGPFQKRIASASYEGRRASVNSPLANALSGLSPEVYTRLASLNTGDTVSIDRVDFVALRMDSPNRDSNGNAMILVQAEDMPNGSQQESNSSGGIGSPYSLQQSVNGEAKSTASRSLQDPQANVATGSNVIDLTALASYPEGSSTDGGSFATAQQQNFDHQQHDRHYHQVQVHEQQQQQQQPQRQIISSPGRPTNEEDHGQVRHHLHGGATFGYAETIHGVAGSDYPILSEVTAYSSAFNCAGRREGGYYADVDSRCQVFHVCGRNEQKFSFVCPNGTLFDQRVFVCNWWFNVDCPSSSSYYHLNNVVGLIGQPADSAGFVNSTLRQPSHPLTQPPKPAIRVRQQSAVLEAAGPSATVESPPTLLATAYSAY